MQLLLILGLILFYAVVAATFNWSLRKYSLWFTSFLAIVCSQALLFGGDYVYRGYWETWNYVALVSSSVVAILTTVAVAGVFYKWRPDRAEVPPNPTPHVDARDAAGDLDSPAARAGGRARYAS